MCRILRNANYKTLEAATGRNAIKLALQFHPDAIILDMNMQDQSGLTTLEQLRADKETASIPVVFLSATAHAPSDRSRVEALGASAYLFSPVQGDTLLSVISGSIERGV